MNIYVNNKLDVIDAYAYIHEKKNKKEKDQKRKRKEKYIAHNRKRAFQMRMLLSFSHLIAVV